MKTVTVNQKDFERCLTALRVLNTWAKFDEGVLVPVHVINLTEKALKPFSKDATKGENKAVERKTMAKAGDDMETKGEKLNRLFNLDAKS